VDAIATNVTKAAVRLSNKNEPEGLRTDSIHAQRYVSLRAHLALRRAPHRGDPTGRHARAGQLRNVAQLPEATLCVLGAGHTGVHPDCTDWKTPGSSNRDCVSSLGGRRLH
jgi:hypothetical protein